MSAWTTSQRSGARRSRRATATAVPTTIARRRRSGRPAADPTHPATRARSAQRSRPGLQPTTAAASSATAPDCVRARMRRCRQPSQRRQTTPASWPTGSWPPRAAPAGPDPAGPARPALARTAPASAWHRAAGHRRAAATRRDNPGTTIEQPTMQVWLLRPSKTSLESRRRWQRQIRAQVPPWPPAGLRAQFLALPRRGSLGRCRASVLQFAAHCRIWLQALSSRFTLTGCGVRSSCAKKLTRSSSSSQRNSCRRSSCTPLRSASRRQ